MSPLWVPPNALGPTETNFGAAARNGTLITASATPHTKGAYSAGQLIAASAEDAYGISILVHNVHVSATVTSYLLDIGIGASGSEVTIIEDLDCWGAPTQATEGGMAAWYLPVFIPKGSRVAARAQALAASKASFVGVILHQSCQGWGMEVPQHWERLGVVTNSNGVSVTPAADAFGSWTTILDPVTKNYRWWHVGLGGLADTTLVAGRAFLEIGIGDTSAAVTTIGSWMFTKGAVESIAGPYPSVPVFQPLVDDDAKGVFARLASVGTEARSVLVYAAQ